MMYEEVVLSAERKVVLRLYIQQKSEELMPGVHRPLVLICPGGGYSFLSDREGEPIAFEYLSAGYHAAVLYYGINEYAVAPGPLKDIAGAVKYIKEHSEELLVDKDAVYVSGFSAGGHVAASLGIFWNNDELLPEYKDCREMIKPAGMILGYPVIDLHSSSKKLDIGIQPGQEPKDIQFGQKHPKMPLEKMFVFDEKENRYFIQFENSMNAYIFGGEYTEQQEDFYSLQNQVNEDTVPAFVWHTAEDNLIYPANTLLLVNALHKYNIPFEYHIFGEGGHGLGLGTYVTANSPWNLNETVAPWMSLSKTWLYRRTKLNARDDA
ncbi:MAG: alpha/beta hydrolase [Lachnospiraceae bacterium]|nr:alpha/beta hydrolase [Lachnospiraceae bacterium]